MNPTHIDLTGTVRMAEHTYQLSPCAPRLGPYVQAGNVFVVVQDPATDTIQVWESTDGGLTFSEADAANHPSCAPDTGLGDNKREYGVARNGATLYIAYMAADARVHVSAFNMGTALWGADFGAGPALGGEPTLYLSYNPTAGNLRLVFQNGLVGAVQWVDVSLAGVWGVAASVITGTAPILNGTAESSDGATWYCNIFAEVYDAVAQRENLLHCAIDAAGNVGTVQTVVAGAWGSHDPANFLNSGTPDANQTTSNRTIGLSPQALGGGQELGYLYGVRTFAAFGATLNGSWNYVASLRFLTATPALNPVWSAATELYRATTPAIPAGGLPDDAQGSVAYYDGGGVLHVAYHLRLADPALSADILQRDFVGGVWGAAYTIMRLTAGEFAAGIDGYWALSGGADPTGASWGLVFGKGDSGVFDPTNANVAQADPYYIGSDVAAPPAITCNNPPSGTVGAAYTHALGVSGGTPPYTFAIIAGALPTGLSLNAATGVISGTPTAAGTFGFTVQVTDSARATAEVSCSITISLTLTPCY